MLGTDDAIYGLFARTLIGHDQPWSISVLATSKKCSSPAGAMDVRGAGGPKVVMELENRLLLAASMARPLGC